MAKKSKKRRAWTAIEVRELKSMAKKKTAAAKIAKKLKRTEGATRQKAFSIGLSLELPFLTLTKQPSSQARIDAGLDSRPGAMSLGYRVSLGCSVGARRGKLSAGVPAGFAI